MLAALAPASLAAVLTLVAVAGPADPGSTGSAPASATVSNPSAEFAAATSIVLRTASGRATATLESTPAAREFARMLPLQLTLHDPMGQAKSGPLPEQIDVSRAARLADPEVAGIYYWPPSGDVAIVYDDLGQAVPPPGMVRLGSVTSGLEHIASAGNRFTVSIEAI
jgi:hypothetical protein